MGLLVTSSVPILRTEFGDLERGTMSKIHTV